MSTMSWNQKAKPTPLLLLEQYNGGVNVSFRTKIAQKYRTITNGNNRWKFIRIDLNKH